jgi:hypothetical protein
VLAAQCWNPGRIPEAVRYAVDGHDIVLYGDYDVPFGAEGWLPGVYLLLNEPDRMAEFDRAMVERGRDTHSLTRTNVVFALAVAGRYDEALAAADGLIAAAEATENPYVLSFVLWVYGYALREVHPVEAMHALRRGMIVAKETGNRTNLTYLSAVVSLLECTHGDKFAALDDVTTTIRNFHNAGNTIQIQTSMAILATLLERMDCYEPAATIAGFGGSPLTEMLVPEQKPAIAHLRDVLGEQRYESLAGDGRGTGMVEMIKYAYDQIDHARSGLQTPG